MTHPTNKEDRERMAKLKAKKRRPGWQESWFQHPDDAEPGEGLQRQRRHHKDTTKNCSRPGCCGNPRRMKGKEDLTLPERRRKHVDDSAAKMAQEVERSAGPYSAPVRAAYKLYTTLLIIKPDAVRRGLIGPILANLENLQYSFLEMELRKPGPGFWEFFYEGHEGKSFYDDLIRGMGNKPCVFLGVTNDEMGEKLVGMTRLIIGNTDGSSPNSIRGAFKDPEEHPTHENLIHASDSYGAARTELNLVWPIKFAFDKEYGE